MVLNEVMSFGSLLNPNSFVAYTPNLLFLLLVRSIYLPDPYSPALLTANVTAEYTRLRSHTSFLQT